MSPLTCPVTSGDPAVPCLVSVPTPPSFLGDRAPTANSTPCSFLPGAASELSGLGSRAPLSRQWESSTHRPACDGSRPGGQYHHSSDLFQGREPNA